MNSLCGPAVRRSAADIARCAARALTEELETHPKPGLVSFVDCGSHPDMDAECFLDSIAAIEPFFAQLAEAGAAARRLAELQRIGIAAEERMLAATGGRNTHRGAIYCLGLLAAAAGRQNMESSVASHSLGRIVEEQWGEEISVPMDLPPASHGLEMCHRHKLNGVRGEARRGFPSVYDAGLPAFAEALGAVGRAEARVQAFFSLLAVCEDTTILKRGGPEGWIFARAQARDFLRQGGVKSAGWKRLAQAIHRAFVSRNLTAGGTADLLAATLFIHELRQQR